VSDYKVSRVTRKLHIGGKVRVEGWEVLNAVDGPAVDHIGNAKDLHMFEDATFEHLYASHVLEHFDYVNEIMVVLVEWRRVLKPGGRLWVSVPDLDVLARLFLDRANLTIKDRFEVMRMIFGGHIDKYDFHLVGLNDELLADALYRSGFSGICKVANFGLFEDTSSWLFNGVAISVNMVCEKPA
jgi:predicted SAM-dependent methyltransferase